MQKVHYSLILLGFVISMPLQAMDMDKVNALAEQIRAGKILSVKSVAKNAQVQATAEELPAVAAPIDVKPPSIEEAVPVADEQAVAAPVQHKDISVASGATVSEESLGLRKTNLYSEDSVTPVEGKYTTVAPGSSKRFDRAFENAPPMIPHSVDGLLPITTSNNACLGCHMPDVAPSMNATPIPPSHFTNFRPMTKIAADGKMVKEGVEISNTSDIKIVARQEDKLYQGRFNCSQCHAPQAEIKPLVDNNFQPDFRKPEEKQKSNLIDVINEGVE